MHFWRIWHTVCSLISAYCDLSQWTSVQMWMGMGGNGNYFSGINGNGNKIGLDWIGLEITRNLWHRVSKKTATFLYFWNNSVKREPISIIFGIRSPEETLHQKVVNLSTSPKIIMSPHYLVKFQKVIFWVGPISLIGFRVFWLSFNKRTQCQSAAEIITVYLFSRLLLKA